MLEAGLPRRTVKCFSSQCRWTSYIGCCITYVKEMTTNSLNVYDLVQEMVGCPVDLRNILLSTSTDSLDYRITYHSSIRLSWLSS